MKRKATKPRCNRCLRGATTHVTTKLFGDEQLCEGCANAVRRDGQEDIPETIPSFTGTPIKVQRTIWKACLEEAIAGKQWATETSTNKTWNANACDLSRKMRDERLTLTVLQLTIKAYQWWHHRAHLTHGKGLSHVVIDSSARKRWIEFGGKLDTDAKSNLLKA